MNVIKDYEEVLARFSPDGRLTPVAFIWEDGHRYDIDRIVKCERCASRKAGGAGILYTCIVGGRPCHLYYEENYQWFLERKTA